MRAPTFILVWVGLTFACRQGGKADVLDNPAFLPGVHDPASYKTTQRDPCFKWIYYAYLLTKQWAAKAQVRGVRGGNCVNVDKEFLDDLNKLPPFQCDDLRVREALSRQEYLNYLGEAVDAWNEFSPERWDLCDESLVSIVLGQLTQRIPRYVKSRCLDPWNHSQSLREPTASHFKYSIPGPHPCSSLRRPSGPSGNPAVSPSPKIGEPPGELESGMFPKEIDFTHSQTAPSPRPEKTIPKALP
jgi:hypothetical protein